MKGIILGMLIALIPLFVFCKICNDYSIARDTKRIAAALERIAGK